MEDAKNMLIAPESKGGERGKGGQDGGRRVTIRTKTRVSRVELR